MRLILCFFFLFALLSASVFVEEVPAGATTVESSQIPVIDSAIVVDYDQLFIYTDNSEYLIELEDFDDETQLENLYYFDVRNKVYALEYITYNCDRNGCQSLVLFDKQFLKVIYRD